MKGLIDGRVCYRYNSVNTINVPNIYDEVGNPLFFKDGKEIDGAFSVKDCTKSELIDIMVRISRKQPSRPIFDIWKAYFRRYIGIRWDKDTKKYLPAEVCPIGLLTNEIEQYISMEIAASNYNSLPYEGSWLDQPLKVIEAFDAISIGKGHFDKMKINKMRAEARKAKNTAK